MNKTSPKDFFASYTPNDYKIMKISNDGLTTVASIVDICLKTNNGIRLVLQLFSHNSLSYGRKVICSYDFTNFPMVE